jgi:hypothetical protein
MFDLGKQCVGCKTNSKCFKHFVRLRTLIIWSKFFPLNISGVIVRRWGNNGSLENVSNRLHTCEMFWKTSGKYGKEEKIFSKIRSGNIVRSITFAVLLTEGSEILESFDLFGEDSMMSCHFCNPLGLKTWLLNEASGSSNRNS